MEDLGSKSTVKVPQSSSAAKTPKSFDQDSTMNMSPRVAPAIQPSAASKLTMTKAQYCASHPAANDQPYDKIVIGAAIFKSSMSPEPIKTSEILLLKRSVHEIYYPNVFELPSGNVDHRDISLKHALAREVKEETGLEVKRVIAEIPEFIYHTEKLVHNADGTAQLIRKSCVQLNFVVKVEGDVILVNPDEHSVAVWATRKDVKDLDMTDGMRSVVADALAWAESDAA